MRWEKGTFSALRRCTFHLQHSRRGEYWGRLRAQGGWPLNISPSAPHSVLPVPRIGACPPTLPDWVQILKSPSSPGYHWTEIFLIQHAVLWFDMAHQIVFDETTQIGKRIASTSFRYGCFAMRRHCHVRPVPRMPTARTPCLAFGGLRWRLLT